MQKRDSLRVGRRKVLGGIAATSLALATGSFSIGATKVAFAAEGKRLRFSITDPRDPSLDPGSILGGTSVIISLCLYEGLVGFEPANADANGVVRNALFDQLAIAFKSSNDGLRHDFTLKEGVQFHRGYGELTAEDVKFSFERIAGLTGEKLAFADDWGALDHVEVRDRYSGTIVLKTPYAPLLGTTLPWMVGFVAPRRAIEELGSQFGLNPVGTGPYEWVEFAPQQRVLLRKFSGWHGKNTPEFEEIEFVWVRDNGAQEIALASGDIDVGRLPISSIGRFESDSAFAVHRALSLDQIWLGMNLSSPIFKNEILREAIRYGVDVPSIIEGAYEGRFTQATGSIAPGMPIGYWQDAPVYERDVARAKNLVEQANADGAMIRLAIPRDDTLRLVAEIVQANLSEIGLQIEIDIRSDLVSLGAKARELEMFIGSFTAVPPDPTWATQWWRCSGFDKYNWMYWCDAEYDRLDIEGTRELDPAKRAALYIEGQKRWDEAKHTVWLAWPSVFVATRADVEVFWVNSAPHLPSFRRKNS